jgi:hypothetical protein
MARHDPDVRIPRVHTALSGRRVLITDYVEGRRGDELAEQERDRAGEIAFRFYLGLACLEGIVAADAAAAPAGDVARRAARPRRPAAELRSSGASPSAPARRSGRWHRSRTGRARSARACAGAGAVPPAESWRGRSPADPRARMHRASGQPSRRRQVFLARSRRQLTGTPDALAGGAGLLGSADLLHSLRREHHRRASARRQSDG